MDTTSFSISKDVRRAPHKSGPGFKFPKHSFGTKTVLPPVPLLHLQREPHHRYKYSCIHFTYVQVWCEYELVNTFRRKTDADVVLC